MQSSGYQYSQPLRAGLIFAIQATRAMIATMKDPTKLPKLRQRFSFELWSSAPSPAGPNPSRAFSCLRSLSMGLQPVQISEEIY
jgi:hypothetical protein